MKKQIQTIVEHSEVSEKSIEKYLTDQVQARQGLCLKYSNQSESGFPDRLVIIPRSLRPAIFFVELKSKGMKLRKLQEVRFKQLRDAGVPVHIADSKESIDEILSLYPKL